MFHTELLKNSDKSLTNWYNEYSNKEHDIPSLSSDVIDFMVEIQKPKDIQSDGYNDLNPRLDETKVVHYITRTGNQNPNG